MRLARRTRRGMTIVEMLVAAAMCIMGMWLLTWLYQQGLESFRLARSQADLTGQQRMVTSLLTRDLQASHFIDEDKKPNRGRRLSDQTKGWIDGTGYIPPRGGFFRARSVEADFTEVAYNSPGEIGSSRSGSHFLHFTAILQGGSSFQSFSAQVPADSTSENEQYYGTAAEIAYYLKATTKTPGGIQLYDLYRHQRLVARSADDAPAYDTAAANADSNEVMVVSGNKMKTLSDLTVPVETINPALDPVRASFRLSGPDFSQLSARLGDDKLMSNVLSFEVKFTGPQVNLEAGVWPSDAGETKWPRDFTKNSDYPYDNLPYDGMFDTFTQVGDVNLYKASTAKLSGFLKPLQITGVQIRLRTYDPKTRSTRQTTVIVDL